MQKLLRILILFIFFANFSPSAFPSSKPSGFYVLAGNGTCLLYDTEGNVLFNGDAAMLAGKEIGEGDSIETGENAGVILLHYPDMSRMTLNQNSSFKVTDSHSLWLSLGSVWVKISHLFTQPSDFRVESPNAVAVAHGTQFEVLQESSQGASSVHVFEGTVQVSNSINSPSVPLSQGHYISNVKKGNTLKPLSFNLKNIQNPWWKWNLAKEKRLTRFFQTHYAEVTRFLKQNGTPQERMRQIRTFMGNHGLNKHNLKLMYGYYHAMLHGPRARGLGNRRRVRSRNLRRRRDEK